MRAEASLSLGVNSDRLVVETAWFFTRLASCPVNQASTHQSAKPITPNTTRPRPDRHSSRETEETEGHRVSLPFLKDSSLFFYHPTVQGQFKVQVRGMSS